MDIINLEDLENLILLLRKHNVSTFNSNFLTLELNYNEQSTNKAPIKDLSPEEFDQIFKTNEEVLNTESSLYDATGLNIDINEDV